MHAYDIAYFTGLAVSAPVWLALPKARKKVLEALKNRLGHGEGRPALTGPRVLIHAVSLGEINATRTLVMELCARDAQLRVVITATTTAGHTRALELYGKDPRVSVERFPLDFTRATTRLLDRAKPDVVVLMELELWPNFLRLCRERSIPVILVNGRLTNHSLKRYKFIAPVARAMFRSLATLCVQDETYRDRFISVGADPAKIKVTGTMKFDTAQLAQDPARPAALAAAMSLSPGEPLLVAGSTGPGEEQIALDAYRQLLPSHPTLRLAVVPRQPNRFDEAATIMAGNGLPVLRRSGKLSGPPAIRLTDKPVLLGDTLGELRDFYALATVIFVGRSLVDLGPKQHGSDMIEACALGKPVVVGPFTGNFADAMRLLKRNRAILEIDGPDQLFPTLQSLLNNPEESAALSTRAKTTVVEGQGATARHADEVVRLTSRGRNDLPSETALSH